MRIWTWPSRAEAVMLSAGSVWSVATVFTRPVLTRVLSKLYQHSVLLNWRRGFGFCYVYEWRLDLLLCPATTLMHSAVEKLGSVLLWRTVTAIITRFGLSPCFGRSVDVDAVRVPCVLYTIRSVRSTSNTSNLPFPPFDHPRSRVYATSSTPSPTANI